MTREEQIRGALNLYAPSSWNFIGEITPMSKDELQASHEGFIRGAKWADDNPKQGLVDLSQVWHEADEKPQVGKQVLGIDYDGEAGSGEFDYRSVYGIFFCDDLILDWYSVVRWAYIDDLLPKGGL